MPPQIVMRDIVQLPKDASLRVFSIHPHYVDQIRAGTKKYELRGYAIGILPGDWCIVYETRPRGQISTIFQATGFWCLSPEEAWKRYSDHLGIDREGYDKYFDGKRAAYGIEIAQVRKFEPIPYEQLRDNVGFSPPQGVVRWTAKMIHKEILDAAFN